MKGENSKAAMAMHIKLSRMNGVLRSLFNLVTANSLRLATAANSMDFLAKKAASMSVRGPVGSWNKQLDNVDACNCLRMPITAS